jgi:hypothetical protein
MTLDKFNIPFIDFIKKYFSNQNHKFIFLQKPKYEHGMTKEHDVMWIDKKSKVFILEKELYNADKIILHGLWSGKLIQLLFLQPWLLKKCYHVMWGGDFYFPQKQSWIKKQIIKKMAHFITYIKGDYELAQKWYEANGKYHECFMYPSNLYKEYDIKPKAHTTVNIQLGNSADPTNNHIDVLKQLKKYKDEDIKIFVPLSYGDQEYAKEVIKYGKSIFEDKFVTLTEFMPFEKYLEFLGEIDIAIFAHKRQQAMGNTITLLGLGKKVYMRSDITPWKLFKDIDVKFFDVDNIEIDLIDEKIKKQNQQKIKEYFSEKNYLKQLQNLFGNN